MGIFADVIKVMKSNIFKSVLKNGDYRVAKSDVSDSLSKTLDISGGGTNAKNAEDARKNLNVPSKNDTYLIGVTPFIIESGYLNDYNTASECRTYGLKYDDVEAGKIKNLPLDIMDSNGNILYPCCGKLIVETDYHNDAYPTVVQTLILYNVNQSHAVRQYIRKCFYSSSDDMFFWSEWQRCAYKSEVTSEVKESENKLQNGTTKVKYALRLVDSGNPNRDVRINCHDDSIESPTFLAGFNKLNEKETEVRCVTISKLKVGAATTADSAEKATYDSEGSLLTDRAKVFNGYFPLNNMVAFPIGTILVFWSSHLYLVGDKITKNKWYIDDKTCYATDQKGSTANTIIGEAIILGMVCYSDGNYRYLVQVIA